MLDAGCVCAELTEEENAVAVKYRSAGDKYLLIEYGPLELDLSLRLRIHALMQWLTNAGLPGLIDVTPGVRSLQLHYDSRQITLCSLVRRLLAAERTLPAAETMSVPSRVVHLPMAWNDSSVKLAIEKYSQSVRKDAPWNPSNVEFIRRINGLGSVEEVCRSVFETSYLVMGLGDVYLGAPAATPIDPRHRLLTTKYNPARTWTAEGTVGIGGVYMCIYGMDSPGGYQLVGRTLPIWNRYGHNDAFKDGKPWLLRFFDQVRYFEVSETELEQIRADFRRGNYALRIEQEEFSLSTYNRFLADNAASIAAFQERQQKAFVAERERWEAMGQTEDTQDWDAPVAAADEDAPPAGQTALTSHIAGNVWKVPVRDGQHVQEGEPLVVLEAMKMEIAVLAPASGIVHAVKVREGKPVKVGQPLIFFEESPALVSIAQSSD